MPGPNELIYTYVLRLADEASAATRRANASIERSVQATSTTMDRAAAQQTAAQRKAAAAVKETSAAYANQAKAAARAATATEAAGARVQATGKRIARVGRSLTGLSLPILAVGGASVKMAIDFQRSMEMVHTQAGATQKEVDRLSGAVLNLAKTLPQSPQQLSEGLFHLESVGLRGAKAMDALKIAAQGAAVGNSNLEDTATALGSAWLVNIKGGGDLRNVMGLLNATVGAGNVRMGELVQALGTGLLPAAKTAGLSIRDVFGAMAVFTDEGYQASSAAAQFSTALHFLYNPTTKAKDALNSMNLNSAQLAADMHKPNGLLVALRDLKTHLDAAGASGAKFATEKGPGGELVLKAGNAAAVREEQLLGQILPGGRGRILLTLLNQLDRYSMKLEQIRKGQANFGEDLARTQETASFRLRAAWSSVQVAAIQLGQRLMPALVPVLTNLAKAVEKVSAFFQRLPGPVKSAMLAGLAFVAIGGPLALFFGKALEGVGAMIGAFGALGARVAGTTVEMKAFGASTAVATRTSAALTGVPLATGAVAAGGLRGALGGALSRIPRGLGIGLGGAFAAQAAGGLIGGKVGGAVSSIGTGAALGAGLGSVVAPGIGTAVGAIGGAIVGGIAHFLGSSNARADVQKAVDRLFAPIRGPVGITPRVTRPEQQTAQRLLHEAHQLQQQTPLASNKAKIDAQIRSDYQRAGNLAALAFQRGIAAGPTHTTADVLIRGFEDKLKDVPAKFRDTAVLSLERFAVGLNRQGRITDAQLGDLFKRLGKNYQGIVPLAAAAGRDAQLALTQSVRQSKALVAAQDLTKQLQGAFGSFPQNLHLTLGNAESVFARELDFLRGQMRSHDRGTRDDARALFADISKIAKDYSNAAAVGAAANFKQLRVWVKRELDLLQGGSQDVFSRIAQWGLGVFQNFGDAVAAINSPDARKRASAQQTIGKGFNAFTRLVGALTKAGGGRVPGAPVPADSILAALSPQEFVVTGGGEQILENMTFPGVLNWLEGVQPRHFAAGGRYTPGDLAGIAGGAGFPKRQWPTAGAVGYAESRGNPKAHALTPQEDSRGLWQINVRAHPWGKGMDLYDPRTNATAALRVFHEARDSWNPWSTYTGGAYRAFMGRIGRVNVNQAGGGLDISRTTFALSRDPLLSRPAAFEVGFQAGLVGTGVQGALGQLIAPNLFQKNQISKSLTGKTGSAGGTTNTPFGRLPNKLANWTNPNGSLVQVAGWMVPAMKWAKSHGWPGDVSSGYRSYAKQKSLWDGAPANGLVRGVSVGKPGTSNHEGYTFPRGAIDTPSYRQLGAAMAKYPNNPHLLWYGPRDRFHFSATGKRGGGRAVPRFQGGGAVAHRTGHARTAPLANLDALVSGLLAQGHGTAAIGHAVRRLGKALDDAYAVSTGRLASFEHEIQRELARAERAGASRTQLRRLKTILNLTALEFGRRVGALVKMATDALDPKARGISYVTGLLGGRHANLTGGAALAGLARVQAISSDEIRQSIVGLQGAYRQAQRRHQGKAMAEIAGQLVDAMGQLQDAVQAEADAAKQALEDAAQAATDGAVHLVNMANAAVSGLDIQAQIAEAQGNLTGAAGIHQQAAAAITGLVIPSLNKELCDLNDQLTTAQGVGDTALAQQIAEQIAGVQNDILSAMLAAIQEGNQATDDIKQSSQDTADNTSALKDFAGASAFEFRGQTENDLVGYGVGA